MCVFLCVLYNVCVCVCVCVNACKSFFVSYIVYVCICMYVCVFVCLQNININIGWADKTILYWIDSWTDELMDGLVEVSDFEFNMILDKGVNPLIFELAK